MIEDDFKPEIAGRLKEELRRYNGRCCYSSAQKKIIYFNLEDAMHAHTDMQIEAARKYFGKQKISEREFAQWVEKFAENFARFWKKTHIRVASKLEKCCGT